MKPGDFRSSPSGLPRRVRAIVTDEQGVCGNGLCHPGDADFPAAVAACQAILDERERGRKEANSEYEPERVCIQINRLIFLVARERMDAAAIKDMANVPRDVDLWEKSSHLGAREDYLCEGSVDLYDGKMFFTAPKYINASAGYEAGRKETP